MKIISNEDFFGFELNSVEDFWLFLHYVRTDEITEDMTIRLNFLDEPTDISFKGLHY